MPFTRRVFLAGAAAGLARPAATPRELAITMDDVNWEAIPKPWQGRADDRLLGALHKHRVSAALFAVGKNVDNRQGTAILRRWDDAGHLLGNHTWNHRPFTNPATVAGFGAEVDRCDRLLGGYSNFRKLFRFPALKEGNSAGARDGMRKELSARGYRNGAVTVDASDWYYDACLRRKLAADPAFPLDRFRQPYLAHIVDRAGYYHSLGLRVLGHPIRHTLLIHYNLLNVLFLDDLLVALRTAGWTLIHASSAFADPVFTRQPDTVPAGESLVWALAKQAGRFGSELRYPGEDDTYEIAELQRLGLA